MTRSVNVNDHAADAFSEAEEAAEQARINLALLARLAEAEQRLMAGLVGSAGSNPELDADAWEAMRQILITARYNVMRLWDHIENLESGGAR